MINLKQCEIRLTVRDGIATDLRVTLERVTLQTAKVFAHNWLELHRTFCEHDGCDVQGWEVWATRFGGYRQLMSRFPELV